MFKNLRTYWLPVFVLILVSVLGFKEAFAYELLHNNNTKATATGTYFSNTDSDDNWRYEIDCGKLGWSEISSVGMTLSPVGSGFDYLILGNSTSTNWSAGNSGAGQMNVDFLFSPPVWCDGEKVILRNGFRNSSQNTAWWGYATELEFSFDGLPYAQIIKCGFVTEDASCGTMAGTNASDFKTVIWGSFSTSTGGGGGESVSTTTYNFYFSTSTLTATSSSSSGDNSLWISLIALTFLWYGFISVVYKQIYA